MDERVEITDDKSAKAWLETQDHQTQVWFAARCALLGLPGVGGFASATTSGLAFSLLRCTLIAAAAATCSTKEMDQLTHAAEAAYRSSKALQPFNPNTPSVNSADDARDCAEGAARAAFVTNSASATREAAYAAILSAGSAANAIDAATGSTERAIASAALSSDANNPLAWPEIWPDNNMPEALQQGWSALKAQWADAPDDWSFWIEWYEGILNGTPMDWDLIFKIATEITEEEWDAGQVRVAARIREIRLDYRTSVTPPLVRLPNGKWDVQSDTKIPAEPIEFAIAQVEIALTAALGADQGNGLTETSGETILIRKACADFRSLPSAVATSFWNACMGLQRNIGNLYPEDATLVALQNVLYTSVEELCEQDPLIRDRIAKLAALETRRMPTQEERENLQQVPEMVAEDLTPTAQEQLSEAVEVVANTEKPPRIWRAKLVNWLNTLGRGLDGAQKNEKRVSWLLKLARNISGWFFEEE